MSYTKFKIEALYDNTEFKVLVKGWFSTWKSGYIHTNYFAMYYKTKDDAIKAVERYKERFNDL